MSTTFYRVLLIEDDPMVQEVNKQFVEKVEGFSIVGIASNGIEGIQLIKELKPDLAFIDIFMPNQDGLETIYQIRKESLSVDFIAVTAATDMGTVRKVLQNGAFDYVMKPFKFERIKKSLENYRLFRKQFDASINLTQQDLDELRFEQKADEKVNEIADLPKGLNPVTLDKVMNYLHNQNAPVSAEEVAEGVGLARVTARRYLDYLEKDGSVSIHVQYGGVGRPINRYITEESKINKFKK